MAFKILERIEVAKYVITQEKLDKYLGGQSSTPYISLQTHPSEKHKSDEDNLLNNQIHRLAQAMDKMRSRPQDRINQYNTSCKPCIHRDRCRDYRNYLSHDRGYDRKRRNCRQRTYNRKRELFFIQRQTQGL